MKKLDITPQLLQFFRAQPETLIFDGYCSCSHPTVLNEGNSLALIAQIDGTHKVCLFSESVDFAQKVIDPLHGSVELCGVDPRFTDRLKGSYAFQYETHCILCVWNGKPLPRKNEFLHPISPKFAQLVSDGTHYHPSVDEVTECLRLHPSSAIYDGENPVCWCLCHLEKSLGMLYTLPEYRRRGLALEVMTDLCNKVIDGGDIPFAYIVDDNAASLALAPKYNLQQVKRADYFRFVKQ